MTTSYRLPDGSLVFPYDTRSSLYMPWVIMKLEKRVTPKEMSGIKFHNPMARFYGRKRELGNYPTQEQAREALQKYAEEYGLEPAY